MIYITYLIRLINGICNTIQSLNINLQQVTDILGQGLKKTTTLTAISGLNVYIYDTSLIYALLAAIRLVNVDLPISVDLQEIIDLLGKSLKKTGCFFNDLIQSNPIPEINQTFDIFKPTFANFF